MISDLISDRQANILQGLIESYIRLARPIGSAYLARTLSLSISPATVRNTLHELEEQGYIYQPHTSAGRMPTDRGYRFYVDHVSWPLLSQRQRDALLAKLQRQNRRIQASRLAIRALSSATHSLAVGGWMPAGDIEQAGLTEVLEQPEAAQLEHLREISQALADIDQYVQELSSGDYTQPSVFIGSDNPVFAGQHTSWLVRTIRLPQNAKVVLLVVGPKRMPYRRNVSLLEGLADMFEQHYS